MSNSFDPYHQWLGIRDPQRPPNLYRLLGIELFESDANVIETAADRQMAHLRTFQNGPQGDVSQRLLNEVAAAKVCLLAAEKKSAYDAQLRALQPPEEPPVAKGELVDEANLAVVVKHDRLALRSPERGPRAERPWYVSMVFLLPLLAVMLCLVAYRIYRDHFASSTAGTAVALTDAVATNTPDPDTSTSLDAETDAAEETESSDATAAEAAAVDVDTADSAPVISSAGPATVATPDSDTPIDGPHAASDDATDAANTAPGWNAAALAVTGQPARFTTSQPMGAFLLALSQRDLSAAESALQALRVNQALGLPESLFQEAELIRDALAQFWQAVDAGLAQLEPQDPLTLGQVSVTVVHRTETSLTLQAPTGQQHEFDLRRPSMHRDLAVALVQRHFESSPAAGWRLMGTFLAVDREGDVKRAEYFVQLAEQRGFAAGFLTRIIRHLSGDDVSDAPPLSFPLPPRPAGIADRDAIAPDGEAEVTVSLPDSAAQQQAKREVLSPILAELRQQEVPVEQWPQELLKRAESTELDEAARYVLLDNALKRAKSRRDVDASLAIIDVLSRDFGQSRADLRYELLQSITRRLKGEERRRYAESAKQMARAAVEVDNYDEAIRFASLAQSIGRSVPDRFLRRQLLDLRLEIDAIQNAFKALPQGSAEGADATAAVTSAARFRVLSKGDFEHGFNDLSSTDDGGLRTLVQLEIARPASTEQQLALARGWFQLADKLSSVEKVNAMRRAEHWYRTCQAGLSRAQRVEVQQDLDAITAVLGRDSEQMDLTELPPVEVSVGYGTFGVNKNIDAANPKVEALPEVDDFKVTRFLWACAPSRVEYLLPEGATGFEALGIVNAATSDGVRFAVKANQQVVFVSPPVNVMGGRVPIRVELPAGTQSLELIVDPIKNNVFDHSYWVSPRIHF